MIAITPRCAWLGRLRLQLRPTPDDLPEPPTRQPLANRGRSPDSGVPAIGSELSTRQVGTPGVDVAYLLERAAVERPELVSGVAERDEGVDVDAVRHPEQGFNLGMVTQVEGREASAKAGSPRC
jgi:hypothetical protein